MSRPRAAPSRRALALASRPRVSPSRRALALDSINQSVMFYNNRNITVWVNESKARARREGAARGRDARARREGETRGRDARARDKGLALAPRPRLRLGHPILIVSRGICNLGVLEDYQSCGKIVIRNRDRAVIPYYRVNMPIS